MPSWISKLAAVASGLMLLLPFLGILPHNVALYVTLVITGLGAFAHAATGPTLPGGQLGTIVAALGTAAIAIAGLAGGLPPNVANYVAAVGAALVAFGQALQPSGWISAFRRMVGYSE